MTSALYGQATPEEIKLLKNSEQNQSETVQKLVQQIVDNQKGIVLYQSVNGNFSNKPFSELTEFEKEEIFTKEFINYEQIKNDEQKLAEDINKHLDNNFAFGQMINFGYAPAIIQEFGVPNKIMLMSQNKYDCSTNRKEVKGSKHNISDDVMKKLPSLLSDPLMIAYPLNKSNYRGNSRIVVSLNAVDENNKPINVIIDYDWQGKKINIIPSAYGKEDFSNYVKKCLSENKIIYTNKKVLESQTRVQFPRGNKNSNNSITDKEDIIKAVYKNAPNIFYQSVQQDILDKNVTPVNIQVDSVPNFDNVKDLKNWIQENLNLLGDVTIKDNNRIVHFSKSNIGRSMKGVNRDSAKRESYSGLKELVENAVYGYNKSVDSRHSKRNNGQEIYYNAFVYNNKIYGVEISADIPKNNGTKYSYAGHKIKVIEMASEINGTKLPDLTDANISISDIQSLFNPADNTDYQKAQKNNNKNLLATNNPEVYFQTVFHGTPHRFDEFSTEHIGSGEGAQAHGWGLYFAGDKKVSEDYRKTLSDTIGIGTEILVDNVTYKKIATNTYKKKENIYDSVDDYLNKALNFIETQGSKKKALKYVQEQIDNHKDAGYFDDAVYYIRIKDALNEIIKAKITKYADDYGQLYEVDIPEDDVLLDEYELLSEQNKNVRKLVENIIQKENLNFEGFDPNGRDLYKALSKKYGSDKQASLLLNEYGIKGIAYDGRRDGRCYVIFEDKAVDVIKKYYQIANKNIDDSLKYKNLPQELKDAVDYIYNGQSVYDVTGEEFPDNGGNFTSLLNRVADFYKNNFSSKVKIENFGEVLLDKKSVKNSSYHNFNEKKVNAFAAVPYVLQNGKIANYKENYNGKNEDRYLFVAPITIKGDEYFCEVVVKATDRLNKSGVKRFYLHEVELKEKLDDVFLTPYGRTSSSSKSIIADLINKNNPQDENKLYLSANNNNSNSSARGFFETDKNLITVILIKKLWIRIFCDELEFVKFNCKEDNLTKYNY